MLGFRTFVGSATVLGVFLVAASPSAGQPVVPAAGGGWYYGDYLHGAADVIRAQAFFMVEQQKALLLKEDVRQKRLVTRRQHIEQWLWELENIPSIEDFRVRWKKEEMKRAWNDPPLTEIWSAKPLNDMLQHVLKTGVANESALEPLRPEILAKINVTNGKASGNLGLIKNGAIRWPLLLRRVYFDEDRQRLDDLIGKCVTQAIERKDLDVEAMREIQTRVNGLHDSVSTVTKNWSQLPDWSPTLYMDAKHFLNQFDDALRALQQPDAYQYLSGLRAPEGQTVPNLVAYMKSNGLFFAPASPGSESAYTALYRAMRDYAFPGPTLNATPPK